MDPITPTTFALDLIGANGTPFRFIYYPEAEEVQYFDRRYTLTPGQPGYGPNHMNENGQSCGPRLNADTFHTHALHSITGWHEESAWDVDVNTRRMVAAYINDMRREYHRHLKEES